MKLATFQIIRTDHHYRNGFTLLEALASIAILGVICSGVVITINRCIDATETLLQTRQAYEVAHENLEQILVTPLLTEGMEQGTSERYPNINWETIIETFSEPVQGNSWARAICAASYEDQEGETQRIELVHWLTDLTEAQLNAMDSNDIGDHEVFASIQDAAEFAEVDVDTIEEWVAYGLLQTAAGEYPRKNLEIFMKANGTPTEESMSEQITEIEEPGEETADPPEDGTKESRLPGDQSMPPQDTSSEGSTR